MMQAMMQRAVELGVRRAGGRVLRGGDGPQRVDGAAAVLRPGRAAEEEGDRAGGGGARAGAGGQPGGELRGAACAAGAGEVGAAGREERRATQEEAEEYQQFVRGILRQLAGHYVELSRQKYSSNVVEKSIANSLALGDRTVFEELLAPEAAVQLLENQFGTYVLQKLLQSMKKKEVNEVDAMLRENRLLCCEHKNRLTKWEHILERVSSHSS